MFCTSCGFNNGDKVNFCMRCGTKLMSPEEAEEEAKKAEEAAKKAEEEAKKAEEEAKKAEEEAKKAEEEAKKAEEEAKKKAEEEAKKAEEEAKKKAEEEAKKAEEEAKKKAEEEAKKAEEEAKKAKEEVKEKAEEVKEEVKEKAEEAKEEVKEKAEEAKEEVKEKAEEVKEEIKEKAEEVKEEIKEKAEEVKEEIKEKAEEVKEEVKEKAEEVKEEVKEKAEEAKEALKEAVEEKKVYSPIPADKPKKEKGKGKGVAIGVAAVAAIAAIGGGGYYVYHINTPEYKYAQCIKEAEKFADDQNYPIAIENYLKAEEFQALDDDDKKELYKAYIAMGDSLIPSGQYDDALVNYEAAKKYAKDEEEILSKEAVIYFEQAKKAVDAKNVEEAEKFFNMCADKVKQDDEFNTLRFKLFMLKGDKALENKDYSGALTAYSDAERFATNPEEAYAGLAKAYAGIAKEMAAKDEYNDALMAFEEAYNYGMPEEEYQNECFTIYETLAKQALATGDLDVASRYVERAFKVQNSSTADRYEELKISLAELDRVTNAMAPIQYDENGNVIDLGGMEIIVRDWWSPEEPSAPMNDYQEARKEYFDWIQETYNFKIREVAISDWESASLDFINYASTGGDNENYVFTLHAEPSISEAMNSGLMYDLAKLDCLDFSQAKFTQNRMHELYSTDYAIYAMNAGIAEPGAGIFFNKRILEEIGITAEDLYELQRTGNWTWDVWTEIMDHVQRDIDGDGEIDVYGTTQNDVEFISYCVYSNGGAYVGRENGMYTYRLEDPETVEGFEFAKDVLANFKAPNKNWDEYKTIFREGKAAFMPEESDIALSYGYLAESEDDYGFLCFPMGPQASDYTNVGYNNIYAIPACYDDDRAWKIAFAWNLYTNPVPGYEDYQAWKEGYRQGMMDSESIDETLELMVKTNMITFDGMIPNLSVNEDINYALVEGKDVSKTIKGMAKTWQKYIEDANQ